MSITLALDAMGGDSAPQVVIEGAALSAEQTPDLNFIIFGHESVILPLLKKFPILESRVKFIHTDEVVTNETKVLEALRRLPQSSMRLAIQSVTQGRAQAVVSAGNTGAYMALSKMIFKTLDGVDRPAIAAPLPTIDGACIALDLGANVDCSADNLYEFAVMGNVMARRLLSIERPRIGLLNVGAEDLKGNDVVQLAAQKIKASVDLNFLGFVEGNDLSSGRADVIVTDGFTGNVALKTVEGTARMIVHAMQGALSSSWRGKLGYLIARPALQLMKKQMDPRLYNGAVFLGLKGIAVKSHGGTDALGFANAIHVAHKMVCDADVLDISQEIESKLRVSA